MEFTELTKKRREHIKSCRENNDKSHEIIAKLYSDPSHFVYELLQNADDAKASEVFIELNLKCFKLIHNGSNLFDYNDIASITTVGSSTKKDDVNAIGKFGAGFKSVFGITTSPVIHSGDYHFKIVDFIVPEKIDPIDTNGKTIIILPFNKPEMSNDDSYEQISERLRTLKAESILFVRNIREIQWKTEEDKGHYLSEIDGDKACIISQQNDEDKSADYLLFTKYIEIDGEKLNLSVAYAFDPTACIINPLHDTRLFVFFPTNERTGLNFMVHAPYKTTPSRESIPFKDPQNKTITDEIAELFCNSISKIKDNGYFNVDFLKILPINKFEDHPIYNSCFKKLKVFLEQNNILPTSDGTFTKATNALLAREKALTILLDKEDCTELFEKENWLDTNITYNKTKELRDYIIDELNIREINMEMFCKRITETFMKKKNDDWLIHFYSSIIKNKELYREKTSYQKRGILRESPIIPLLNGNYIPPENETNELQVYLPTEQESEFNTVKISIAENENALEFLKALGLKKPDRVSEIKEFIAPKYKFIQKDKNQYLKDFIKSFKIWTDSDEYKKSEVVDILKNLYFTGGINTQDMFLTEKPENVYIKTERLQSWFDGNQSDNIVFLVNELEQIEYKQFIEKLGVLDKLKIIKKIDKDMVNKDSRYIQRVEGFNPYLSIDGLIHSLDNINISRSIALWDLLLKNNPKRLFGYTKRKTYLYQDFSIGEREDSTILKALKNKYWLFDNYQNLLLKNVFEITIDDLNDGYTKGHDDIEKLIEALGLKLDKVKQFEKENPDLVVITKEEKDEFEKYKREKAKKEQDELTEDVWNPDYAPDDVSILKDDNPLENVGVPNLAGQDYLERNNPNSSNEETQHADKNEKSSKGKHSKEIGNWGEQLAKRYLENKYKDKNVIWLNVKGNTGRGYDFVIRDESNDIAYYEIKSKMDETPTLFEVSGLQWEWARSLYNSKKGDMYRILLISNVGTNKAIIREFTNPISLWKDGGIYAHPVNIKL